MPACQGHRTVFADVQGNAFYCLKSNFIAYDDVALMPHLAESVRDVLGRARSRTRVGPRDPGPGRERRAADRVPGTAGRLLRRRVPRPRRPERQRTHVETWRSRSLARGDAPVARLPGPVRRRPVGTRQRLRPDRRVPGRLRVRCRAVCDLLRDSAGSRGGPLLERGGGAERRRDRRRGRDPAHGRPAERLLLRRSSRTTYRSRPTTSSRSTARSPARSRSAVVPRSHTRRSRTGSSTASTTATSRSTSRSCKTSTTRSATSASRR